MKVSRHAKIIELISQYDIETQEELAEKMSVSRQTVSKWELDNAFPEMEKAICYFHSYLELY